MSQNPNHPGIVFTFYIEPDDESPRGHFSDKATENEVLERIDRGDDWAWFCVKVTAQRGTEPLIGEDTLGGCCYASEADFRANLYPEMCENAAADLYKKEETARFDEIERTCVRFELEDKLSPWRVRVLEDSPVRREGADIWVTCEILSPNKHGVS